MKLDEREVWKRPLAGGDYALGFLNRGDEPRKISASWDQLNLDKAYAVRDLWRHEDLGQFSQALTVSVEPHETVLLRLSPASE